MMSVLLQWLAALETPQPDLARRGLVSGLVPDLRHSQTSRGSLGEGANAQAKQELLLLPFCRFNLGIKGLAFETYQISAGPEKWGPLCNYLTAKKA